MLRISGHGIAYPSMRFRRPSCVSWAQSGFTVFNNKLYFTANDGNALNSYSGENFELFSTDGTASGTALLIDIKVGNGQSGRPGDLTVFHNKLWFVANDDVNNNEYNKQLWSSDGTTAGTAKLADIEAGWNDGNKGPMGLTTCSVMDLTYSGTWASKLFFHAEDSGGTRVPWVSDGTVAGTKVIKAGVSVGHRANPMGCFNSWVYFHGSTGGNTELWRTDGTAASTGVVSIINPSGIATGGYPAHKNSFVAIDFPEPPTAPTPLVPPPPTPPIAPPPVVLPPGLPGSALAYVVTSVLFVEGSDPNALDQTAFVNNLVAYLAERRRLAASDEDETAVTAGDIALTVAANINVAGQANALQVTSVIASPTASGANAVLAKVAGCKDDQDCSALTSALGVKVFYGNTPTMEARMLAPPPPGISGGAGPSVIVGAIAGPVVAILLIVVGCFVVRRRKRKSGAQVKAGVEAGANASGDGIPAAVDAAAVVVPSKANEVSA